MHYQKLKALVLTGKTSVCTQKRSVYSAECVLAYQLTLTRLLSTRILSICIISKYIKLVKQKMS